MAVYFSARAAAQLAHISPTKLHFWHKKQLVRASVRAQRGRGGGRYYTLLDVLLICLAAELSAMGIAISRRRPLLEYLRNLGVEPSEIPAQAVLISDLAQRCELVDDAQEAARRLARMPRAIKISLGQIARRLLREAAQMRGEGLTIVVPP